MTASHTTRRIWLTGATSGIGRALAMRLLDQGHRVALSARRHDALVALAGDRDNALLLPLDVGDRQAVLAAEALCWAALCPWLSHRLGRRGGLARPG